MNVLHGLVSGLCVVPLIKASNLQFAWAGEIHHPVLSTFMLGTEKVTFEGTADINNDDIVTVVVGRQYGTYVAYGIRNDSRGGMYMGDIVLPWYKTVSVVALASILLLFVTYQLFWIVFLSCATYVTGLYIRELRYKKVKRLLSIG
jgi:hypothetical protein